MRRALVGLIVVFAFGVPSASASAPPGPAWFSTGVMDAPVFQDGTDAVRIPWLQRAHAIGSSWVRLNVYWSLVAPWTLPPNFRASDPAEPAYNWSSLDESVRQATANGQNVLLSVFSAPPWAQGPGGTQQAILYGAWEPNPNAFSAFARALAERYSGHFRDGSGAVLPRVRDFQAWNEPNLWIYIQPQWAQTSSGQIIPASPIIYRYLLNAFYAGVKSVQPSAVVISGGTAPYGDPPGGSNARMQPALFYRELFCLKANLAPKSCPNPPHLDGLDHHPYAIAPNVKARHPDDISVPDLGKITRIVNAGRRAHHVFPAGPKQLWITELDWSSNPPNPNAVSLTVQAQFVALAFYEVWQQGVTHAFWYQIRDPLSFKLSFTGGGLFFGDGTAKPAATAYRFPFVAVAIPHRRHLYAVWGRSPGVGRVTVAELVHGGWRVLARLRTSGTGIFYARLRLRRHLPLEAQLGGSVSPIWTTS